jgi:hypothetical protein
MALRPSAHWGAFSSFDGNEGSLVGEHGMNSTESPTAALLGVPASNASMNLTAAPHLPFRCVRRNCTQSNDS